MNFTKLILSLLMMSVIAQGSSSDLDIAYTMDDAASSEEAIKARQKIRYENRRQRKHRATVDRLEVNKKNRGGCCSCIKTTMVAAGMFTLGLIGWGTYDSYLLGADALNMPLELKNCVEKCDQPDACYDQCAQQVFSVDSGAPLFSIMDTKFRQKNRNDIKEFYDGCVNGYFYGDVSSDKKSKDCVLRVARLRDNNDASVFPLTFKMALWLLTLRLQDAGIIGKK